MAFLAILLGLFAVYITDLSLLKFIEPTWENTKGDFIVIALVLGAGTEELNTLTKYLGYVKDGRKAAVKPKHMVTIVPYSPSVRVGEKLEFRPVVVNGTDGLVDWKVAHVGGGDIDNISGMYTAPDLAGTYTIVATSREDSSVYALTNVTVT